MNTSDGIVLASDLTEGNIDATADPDFYHSQAADWGTSEDGTRSGFTLPPDLITSRGRGINRVNTHYDRILEDLAAQTVTTKSSYGLERLGLNRSLINQQRSAVSGLGSFGRSAATGQRTATTEGLRAASDLAHGGLALRRQTALHDLLSQAEGVGYSRETAVDDIIRDFEAQARAAEIAYLLGTGHA